MEYIDLNYLNEGYLDSNDKCLWSMYREGVVMPGKRQGGRIQSRGSDTPGELGSALEDSPGLTLPLGRGHP